MGSMYPRHSTQYEKNKCARRVVLSLAVRVRPLEALLIQVLHIREEYLGVDLERRSERQAAVVVRRVPHKRFRLRVVRYE